MTIKQIAEVVGRDERTVRNWVYTASEKSSVYLEKMSASVSSKPADFNEKEVFEIMKAGLGEKLAGVYAYNALLSKQLKTPVTTKEEIAGFVAETVTTMMPKLFDKFERYLDKKFASLNVPTTEKQINSNVAQYLEGKIQTLEQKLGLEEKSNVILPNARYNSGGKSYSKRPKLLFPILSFRKPKDKVIMTLDMCENNEFKLGDKISFVIKNDCIILKKNGEGFILTKAGSSTSEGYMSTRHVMTAEEEKQLPFEVRHGSIKQVIKGKIENGDLVFMFSDVEEFVGRYLVYYTSEAAK